MTVGVAWVAKGSRSDELWIATDSRLSGDGNVWDECPKLLPLPRAGCVAAFSGTTAQAYPLLLGMANSILGHRPSQDGNLELNSLLEHLANVVSSMMSTLMTDPLVRPTTAGREFASRGDKLVIGGYSRQNGLVIRPLTYERSAGGWTFARVKSKRNIGPNKPFYIFGDRVAAPRYAHLLKRRLALGRKLETDLPFHREPLEALWDFLRMAESSERPLPRDRRPYTVGGSIQAARVVGGAQVVPHVVRWGDGDDDFYLLGRRLLAGENVDLPLIEETQGRPRLAVRGATQWQRSA